MSMSVFRSLPQDPVPLRRVNIYVTREVAYNLDKMFQITKSVLGKLGCEGCHSGRFLDFQIMEDFVVNAKSLEVTELPGGTGF
jgi:hypothetical protein